MEVAEGMKDTFYTLVTKHISGTINNLSVIKTSLEEGTNPFSKEPSWKTPLQTLSLPKEFTCVSCIDYISLSSFGFVPKKKQNMRK